MARRILVVMLSALWVAACGAATQVNWDDSDYAGQDTSGNQDIGGVPDSGGKVDTKIPDAPPGGWQYQIILVASPNGELDVNSGENVSLAVVVIDHKNNANAVDYPVGYAIAGSQPNCEQGEECASLTAYEAATNGNGAAAVTFLSGTEAPVEYTVKITGPDAAPVFVTVTVNPKPTGDLKIIFDPSDPAGLDAVPNTVKVVVGTGFKQCSMFAPTAPWTGLFEKTVSGVSATPIFPGLDPDAVYWVTMLGWRGTGAEQHLVVYGCLDNVKVGPVDIAGETKVTLKVSTVILNPAGTYEMVNHFDFTDVAVNLPGTAGQIFYYIDMVFYNPGKAMLEGIKLLVSSYLPAWVTNAAFALFEDALADYITTWIFDQAPQPIKDFLKIGQDLMQIVNNLELTGQLKLSKLSATSINGKETFYGIRLYWKWGCEPNEPDCGEYYFGLDDLNNTQFPLDLIDGEWNGNLVGFDGLQIGDHFIELNYGKLIMFVINEMMIPAVTDYDNLDDMLYSIVDCQALAESISSGILSGIGIDEADLEDFCNSALGAILGPVTSAITNLTLPSTVNLTGNARLLDVDGDLKVDKIINGAWKGNVTINSQNIGEVTGDFTAERASYPGN